jgi:archaeosine synthase beta-subunit
MNESTDLAITDKWIVSRRGSKNQVDPQKPYGWLVEKERSFSGVVEDTAIIFLTNRECTFRCLMCDLWKNTTDFMTPKGSIPDQIEWALAQMPPAKHLKLYNSGSFFDRGAIPAEDYERIASLINHFETVIVECHPRLVGDICVEFRDMLKPKLNIALGLETVNQDILLKLNKKMTLKDFSNSVGFLSHNNIGSRAFILLRPPFMTEEEGIFWAEKSIDFAFKTGVECCTIIPVREGNGAMEHLITIGNFTRPDIKSLEKVIEYGIDMKSGRVFADLWDLNLFSNCPVCFEKRADRLKIMNLTQVIPEKIHCNCDEKR